MACRKTIGRQKITCESEVLGQLLGKGISGFWADYFFDSTGFPEGFWTGYLVLRV